MFSFWNFLLQLLPQSDNLALQARPVFVGALKRGFRFGNKAAIERLVPFGVGCEVTEKLFSLAFGVGPQLA